MTPFLLRCFLIFGLSFLPLVHSSQIDLRNFIFNYVIEKNIHNVVIFSCKTNELLILSKKFFSFYINCKVQESEVFDIKEMDLLLQADYSQIAIVLDLDCKGALRLLRQASFNDHLFNAQRHWIVINTNSVDFDEQLLNGARLDSRLFFVNSGLKSGTLEIRAFFRIGGTYKHLLETKLIWMENHSVPMIPKRNNFQNALFKGAVVIVESNWEKWQVYHLRHLDPAAKLGYTLFTLLSDYHNFSVSVFVENTWGYSKINGTYNGVLGLLQTKQIEVATSLLFKEFRIDYVDYTTHFHSFRPRFIFRKPPISSTQNIYLLTFSVYVWYSFAGIIILTSVLYYATENLGEKSEEDNGFFDFLFTGLAIICDQGSSTTPTKISSRIVFWLLLMIAVLFGVSYSASIVALLQASDNNIKTLADLIDSRFKLKMQDIEYNIRLVNITRSSLIKRLFWEKLFTQPKKEAFVDMEEGVRAVRKEMVAYYVDVGSNKYISDTFEEDEKCQLDEIQMIPSEGLYTALQKRSPYKETFMQDLFLFREVGLTGRWHSYWYQDVPKCPDQINSFTTVSLQDFLPALYLMIYGILASCIFLIFELIYYRINKLQNNPIEAIFSKNCLMKNRKKTV